MKTPLELATEHARSIVANRGQWVEPLDWREIELLLDERQSLEWNQCDCEDAS